MVGPRGLQGASADMRLVDCTEDYWDFVRTLRMDERVSGGFIETARISPQMQREYMLEHAKHYKILLINDEPAGYVGVVNNDIRVCTHPDHQGKGGGSFMIREIMKEYPDAIAKVKVDNHPSANLFERCGYQKRYIIYERPVPPREE